MAEKKPTESSSPEEQDNPEFEVGHDAIEDEGWFDAVKPFKQVVINKLKGSVPGDVAGKAIDLLVPDSAIPVEKAGALLGKAMPTMRKMVQSVKFKKLDPAEASKMAQSANSARATTQAFNELPTEIKEIKRAEALAALKRQGPPPARLSVLATNHPDLPEIKIPAPPAAKDEVRALFQLKKKEAPVVKDYKFRSLDDEAKGR